jgi:arabinogalactan endo-1,4-beta-galactosidase
MQFKFYLVLAMLVQARMGHSQAFYFGADLSYVHEMEDCGVVYHESGQAKDVYQIFAEHQCNLVRLRLWHTPKWYDGLNSGKRYSDFQDVRQSIIRAKAQGMNVLLDFHLSDNWADPGHQVVPAAWLGVVDNLPRLKDSLYNYISKTLLDLNNEGLLPEMVQIGNETNRGILLAPAVDAAGWSLDWNRNSQLFKRAIQAVRDVENTTDKTIKVALHIAGPAEADWLMAGFWSNGVTDFDVIGLSYYWAWHKPTSITDVGNIVSELRQNYPGKEVMIFETGYPWTLQWEDNANNIITELNPGYAPASPDNQRKWLVDMTQTVINKGAKGVLYWEPAWQSSACSTQWGQGSHQEHATFFDFQDNLLIGGGMEFMAHPYQNLLPVGVIENKVSFSVWPDSQMANLIIQLQGNSWAEALDFKLVNSKGELITSRRMHTTPGSELHIPIPVLPPGIYYCSVFDEKVLKATRGVLIH